jgi:DUF1009 family protein
VSDRTDGVLGLIAGQGAFPLTVARAAHARGQKLLCVAFRDLTDPEIDAVLPDVRWIHLGEVMDGLAAFRSGGVSQAVMAGKVPKGLLFGDVGALRMDDSAEALMGQLQDQRDDSILGKVADFLALAGIQLLPQWALAPELLPPLGPLGAIALTREQQADVAFGFPIAKQIGELDIGQTIVVKRCAVIAVEAIDGTDATIRRAGEIVEGTCVVKVAKPRQDPRFDVPTIGPATVECLASAGAAALAFEAGATVVLDRPEVVRLADAHGIAVVGVDTESLASEAG